MDIDIDQKAVNLTYFFFKTPSYRWTTAWLVIVSFIFGLVARLDSGKTESLVESFLYGGTDGILILALPALLAAVLATFFVSRKQFKQGFKYFSFISFACAVVYGVIILFGLIAGKRIFPSVELNTYVIVGNALVLVVWLAATWIALAYKKKSFILCPIHPLTNLAFIVLWNKFAFIESSVALGYSPVIAIVKLAIASLILLMAMAALVFIINAPTKRNFGISTIDTVTMFFAQWVSGNKGLETILAETGEIITTPVGVVSFKHGKQTKATFVVPQVHYGPIGNLGGSEYPGLLSEWLKQETGAPGFVFKGAANHDFNPIYSSDLKLIQNATLAAIGEHKKRAGNSQAAFLQGRKDYSQVFGLNVDNTAFLTLSRQPQNTEDINQALGIALTNKVVSKGFTNAIIVDRHNCKVDGSLFGPGSKAYRDYEKAIDSMTAHKGTLLLGVAESPHAFGVEEGIAKGGLKAAVFSIRGKTACFLVIDANNCDPRFREMALKNIKEHHSFDFLDILTTDSHAVNSISGVHNPLGERVNKEVFLSEALATIESAIKNITPCTATASVKEIEIEVLGPQRSSELVITVNSLFAILKILAPIIFIGSIILAFLALIMVK